MSVVDQRRRRTALDGERSFLVRAPAGSGKTELLIQRYLALLARASRPEAVVAITFTRKAAAEMRRRVMDALARAGGPRPRKEHEAATWELASAALSRDREQRWGLLENPRRFAIRTFDSLWASIVNRAPWLSRLGPPPAPTEDASALYAEAASRTVELLEEPRFVAPMETLLRHVDNNQPKLAKLLAGLLAHRDQWLRHLAGRGPEELRAEGERALESIILAALGRARDLAPDAFLTEAPGLASFAAQSLKHDKPDHPLIACEGLAEAPEVSTDALPQWRGLAALALKQDGGLYSPKGVSKAPGFPPKCPEKARLQSLLSSLDGDGPFIEALAAVRQLPPAHYDHDQWAVAEALIRLLPVAAGQLWILFQERRQVDFTELAQGAARALGGEQSPTDLAFALDAAIEHLLVDEFQDTSFTQLYLLERLTAGWTPGDGRTLFLVGDPMQSIYRFREAEVGNFLDAERLGRLGDVELETLTLEANFRSRRNIVEWVNRIFERVLAGDAEPSRGAVTFSPSTCSVESEPGPEVAIHPLAHGTDGKDGAIREEARRTAEIIARTRRDHPDEKVAVLVRERNHLGEVLRTLEEAGIRYQGVDLDPLSTAPVVQDLLSLTAALLHPADRLAWLAVLRAPWCGLTLTELHALCGARSDETVWQALCNRERTAALSADAQLRLERLGRAVAAPRPRGLRAWVEGVWLAIGGPAAVIGAADLDNAQTYFDLLDELDEGRDCNLELLRERVDKLYAAPDPAAGDHVQVMTIHKAKGLQFDVVIVPGMGRPPKRPDQKLLRWMEVPSSQGGRELLLAPSRSAAVAADPIHDAIQRIEAELEENEARRLLYVATTRAKRELHLLGAVEVKRTKDGAPDPRPAKHSLLSLLWPAVQAELAAALQASSAAAADSETAGAASPAPRTLRRLPADWRPPALPAAASAGAEPLAPAPGHDLDISFHWVGQLARHVGTVTHVALAEIARDGLDAWDAARLARERPRLETELRALGVGPEDLPDRAEQVERALRRTLADERGRWVLASSHTEARGELAVAGMAGGRLVERRIDRTFVDASGVRWIVDFKTSSHEGGGLDAFLDNELERYRGQMEEYRELFSSLDPGRPIRVGLYFPLMGAWREYEAGRATGAAR